jgi:hypothetical protein
MPACDSVLLARRHASTHTGGPRDSFQIFVTHIWTALQCAECVNMHELWFELEFCTYFYYYDLMFYFLLIIISFVLFIIII